LPEELEQRVVATGGTIARNEHGITLVVGVAQKREVAEAVWASGHDVVHILPLRSSLEDLYMKTVGTEGGVA